MSLFRKPWFSVAVAAVTVALIGTIITVLVLRDNTQDEATPPVPTATSTVANESGSLARSEAAPSSRSCPPSTALAGDDEATRFKNRVFDYEEVMLMSDPQQMIEALKTRGDPKGLVTQEKLQQLRKDASQAPKSTDHLTYILDRQQSQYDLDDNSGKGARTAYVRLVYLSCRDGMVVNDPVVDSEDLRSSIWVLENGAWRVIE